MAFFQHGIGKRRFSDSFNFNQLKLAAPPCAACRPLKSPFFNGLSGHLEFFKAPAKRSFRRTNVLTINSAQQRLLADNSLGYKILNFLKKQLPEKCNKPDTELLKTIKGHIETAKENNVRTERAIAKLSYLLLLTDGKLLEVQGVEDYLKQPHPSPSEKIDRLMKSIAVARKLTIG